MMLRKRSRAVQKEQMPDLASDSGLSKTRNTSLFSVPGLFVGFNTKCLSDCESARSPTSPLDYKVFSNLSNAFVRSPRSPIGIESPRKSWDCNRVGLGLVDSLNDAATNLPGLGKVVGVFPDSKNIIFGSKLRINIPSPKTCLMPVMVGACISSPKSLPKNYVVSSQTMSESTCSQPVLGSCEPPLESKELEKFPSCSAEIGRAPLYLNPKSSSDEVLLESKSTQLSSSFVTKDVTFGNQPVSLPDSLSHSHELISSLSASDIANSEDYTRIITRGPNPKTTHIFGDCILESHESELCEIPTKQIREIKQASPLPVKRATDPLLSEVENFLSFCHFCKKKLVEGEDIYMYRGEKAFCSCNCREQEILIDEIEKPEIKNTTGSTVPAYDEEIFLAIDHLN